MKWLSLNEAYRQELNYIKGRSTGKIKSIKTPWESWNNLYMDGFEYGWIVSICGASSMGKTTVLNIIESEVFKLNRWDNFEVLSFNFEMLARRLVGRKLSHYTGKTVKKLYSTGGYNLSKEDILSIDKAYGKEFQETPIFYVEFPLNPEQVLEVIIEFIKIRKLKENNKGLIVTFDHTALTKRSLNADERITISNLMNAFNQSKKIYPKSLYIVLSQLNRAIESPDRKSSYGKKAILNFPVRSDVYMSDAVFTTSDAVIVIHRPEILGLNEYGPNGWPTKNITYCHHLKNREGIIAITRLIPELGANNFKDIGRCS